MAAQACPQARPRASRSLRKTCRRPGLRGPRCMASPAAVVPAHSGSAAPPPFPALRVRLSPSPTTFTLSRSRPNFRFAAKVYDRQPGSRGSPQVQARNFFQEMHIESVPPALRGLLNVPARVDHKRRYFTGQSWTDEKVCAPFPPAPRLPLQGRDAFRRRGTGFSSGHIGRTPPRLTVSVRLPSEWSSSRKKLARTDTDRPRRQPTTRRACTYR